MDDSEKRYDIGNMFPSAGDPRRSPAWLLHALILAAVVVFVSIFVWNSWGSVSWIALDLVICVFIALAMEPAILFLIRHGWKRGLAAGIVWVLVLAAIVGLLTLFGSLFVSQIIGLVQSAPDLYNTLGDFVASKTPWKLPNLGDLGSTIASNIQTSWITDFAGQAISTTTAAFSVLMQLMTIILVTYYIAASGPTMRKAICSLLRPERQRKFLVVWTVAQGQISSFLSSRLILAAISSTVLSIFMIFTNVPYWLPICLFYAIVAQFIPMVGAFIGAILPIVVTWSSNGLTAALVITAFILVYQQIENMLIAPKIQQRTMSVHPAIGLLSVFFFGALFGVLGSFLALPVVASIQVIFNAYTKRQELVDSPLLDDPKPVSKSKVVEAGEVFNEKVIKPMTEHLPRAARGSSVRITTDTSLDEIEHEFYDYNPHHGYTSSEQLDESETIAIPKKKPEELGVTDVQNKSANNDDLQAAASGSKRKLWGSKGMENPPSVEPKSDQSRTTKTDEPNTSTKEK